MTGETENLVLALLQDIRKEQAERSLVVGSVDYMRRLGGDMLELRKEVRQMSSGSTPA